MSITFKSIKKIVESGYQFSIPDYQRGYRWRKRQSEELLEDIMSFAASQDSQSSTNTADNEIYCIQPLVLKKSKNSDNGEVIYNVIDGQQRLTTIYIITKAIVKIAEENQNDNYVNVLLRESGVASTKNLPGYSIEYQTRETSRDFLKDIDPEKEVEAKKNIDFYYMYNVYTAVFDWLNEHKKDYEKLVSTLFGKVCFIWNENESEKETDIFERLNAGKISLTSSELVKALFLNRMNYKAMDDNSLEIRQKNIATNWDTIEYALQKDEFWLFLNQEKKEGSTEDDSSRIDFILDIMLKTDAMKLQEKLSACDKKKTFDELIYDKDEDRDNELYTFRYFTECFKREVKQNNSDGSKAVSAMWKKIRDTYLIFEEWYNDFEIYHYIGFLISAKGSNNAKVIENCLNAWKGKYEDDFEKPLKTAAAAPPIGKDKFKAYLKWKIRSTLCQSKKFWLYSIADDHYSKGMDIKEALKNQSFEDNNLPKKTDCYDLLLLHNVDTVIRQNEKLKESKKYGLPNSTRFPFHLFNKEKWEIEHIRANAGDNERYESDRIIYIGLAQRFLPDGSYLDVDIDYFLKGGSPDERKAAVTEKTGKDFGNASDKQYYIEATNILKRFLTTSDSVASEMDLESKLEALSGPDDKNVMIVLFEYLKTAIHEEIKKTSPGNSPFSDELPDQDKNKIWNFTLLDKGTNSQYQDRIFLIKREFIRLKDMGIKPESIAWDNNKKAIVVNAQTTDVSFIPVCTMKVFSKLYTTAPKAVMVWTQKDAEAYLESIAETLERYI